MCMSRFSDEEGKEADNVASVKDPKHEEYLQALDTLQQSGTLVHRAGPQLDEEALHVQITALLQQELVVRPKEVEHDLDDDSKPLYLGDTYR